MFFLTFHLLFRCLSFIIILGLAMRGIGDPWKSEHYHESRRKEKEIQKNQF